MYGIMTDENMPSFSFDFMLRSISVSFAAISSLLMLAFPLDSISLLDHPLYSDPNFIGALRIASALCLPMVLESGLDYFFTPKARNILLQFKTLLVCGIFVPNVIVSIFLTDDFVVIFRAMMTIQILMLSCTVFLILEFHDPLIWPVRFVTSLIVGMSLIAVLISVHIITGLTGLDIVVSVMGLILGLVTAAKTLEWSMKHRVLMYRVWFSATKLSPGDISNEQLIPIFYVMVFIGYAAFTILVPILRVCGVSVEKRFLLAYATQYVVITLFIFIPGRLARINAAQSDYALENKKTFVQYISHEARGPLQVANMGLELYVQNMLSFEKALSASRASGECVGEAKAEFFKQSFDQVTDIMDACTLAQETLNDMLTFEKVEKGMLALEKTVIPILDFVSSEFRSFSIQARYKDINMVFDWRASLNPLYEHMTIYADKHKISQVLRNLISNALKFTPAGGTIQCVVAVLKVKSAADNETQSVHAVMNSADKGDESVSYKQIDKFSMGGSANSFVENHSPNRTPSVRFSPQTSAGQLDRQSTPDGSLPATFSLVGAWNSVKSKSSKSHIYSGGVETGSYKLENISQDAVRDHVVDPAAIKNMICRIEIHDTGVGISAKNLRKLFGKFVQFDPARMQQGGGSGLGLWLSKNIVEHHGGAIGARSDGVRGKGCIFYVDLPLESILVEDGRAGIDIRHVSREAAIKSTDSTKAKRSDSTDSAILSRSLVLSTKTSGGADILDGQNMLKYVTIRGNMLLNAYEHKYSSISRAPSRTSLACSCRESPVETINEEQPVDLDVVRDTLEGEAKVGDQTMSVSLMHTLKELSASRSRSVPNNFTQRSAMNVLVVDDMASNRKVLRRMIMMQKRDINCFELADGSDAVDVIEKSLSHRLCLDSPQSNKSTMYYDMIFMDSQMTTLDGPEATEILRSKHKYKGLIYGVTGDVNSTERFLKAGADSVFIKPMKKESLKTIIDEYWAKLGLPPDFIE